MEALLREDNDGPKTDRIERLTHSHAAARTCAEERVAGLRLWVALVEATLGLVGDEHSIGAAHLSEHRDGRGLSR